jgi:hypothetical protein
MPHLVGEVVGFSEGPYQYSPTGKALIVYVKDDTGQTHSVWVTRTVLAAEMETADPKRGHRLDIHYRGPKLDRGKVQYHQYSVRNLSTASESVD